MIAILAGLAQILVGLVAILGLPWIVANLIEHRHKRLPAPDDPRLRNEVLLKDWKRRRDARAGLIPS